MLLAASPNTGYEGFFLTADPYSCFFHDERWDLQPAIPGPRPRPVWSGAW